MKRYFVYILSSQRNGTLYIGVTNDLTKRVYEHKNNLVEGFTKKYEVHLLVYFEEFHNMGLLKNVIPAKAGIQKCLKLLDPRFREDDKKCIFQQTQH